MQTIEKQPSVPMGWGHYQIMGVLLLLVLHSFMYTCRKDKNLNSASAILQPQVYSRFCTQTQILHNILLIVIFRQRILGCKAAPGL